MRGEERRSQGRRVVAGIAIVLAGMLAFAVAWPFLNSAPTDNNTVVETTQHKLPQFGLPPPVDTSFVGSAACSECHAEIAERYGSSRMGHSLEALNDANSTESLEHGEFAPPGSRRYLAERPDGKLTHHEIMMDSEGPIYDQAEEVAFRVGSGNSLQAYLINREGVLFQSPIGYDPQNAKWELAHGYHPSAHERFGRRVGDDCLRCHSGRTLPIEPDSDRYEPAVFAESAIGCERCHGPGKAHVEKQAAGKTKLGHDDTIVNPKLLEPSRRESVCNQCHLHGEATIPRYGRGFDDFRPGMRLDDAWVVFVSNAIGEANDPAARGQVEQMRSSRCFMQSDGKLGCTTCHDPHRSLKPAEREAHYRAKCLQCHADKGCSLDAAQQAKEPASGSCIHCHMAPLSNSDRIHAARTDHRLQRVSQPFSKKAPITNPEEWTFFDGADHHVPPREAARTRGLALMAKAGRRDRQMAMRAEFNLVDGNPKAIPLDKILMAVHDDMRIFEPLGRMYMILDRRQEAVKTWEFGYLRNPNNEAVLAVLSMVGHEGEDPADVAGVSEELLSLNPWLPLHLGRYANALLNLGNLERAQQVAERSVRLDPSSVSARMLLGEIYRVTKQEEKAKEQLTTINRLQAVGSK